MAPVKRVTSIDVAQKAQVSRTTVSFVLNNVPGVSISEATRKRVKEAAESLNYHPNAAGRKLVSGKSNTLGLVLNQSPEQIFADAFLPQVMMGVERAAAEQGYNVLLKPVAPGDMDGYMRLIQENHVDGLLLSGPRHDDQEIIRLHRDGVPIMLMGQLPGSDIPFVDINAAAAAEAITEHLVYGGHREIAFISNAPLSYTSAQQRRSGYLCALEKAGIQVDPALMREGAYTPASGFQAMTELLESAHRLTAVFVASDVVAMGAMLAIKKAGLCVPDDIAVAGFDDIPLAEYMDPPLTTVRLPAYALGWAGGERLVRLVRGEALHVLGEFVATELVIRTSSIKAPALP